MEEDNPNEKPTTGSSRHRSPTFSKEESIALVNIVEKYKDIILNKSTTSATNRAKEIAWMKIAKIFNGQGFHHERSADSLKMKWENLKRFVRKYPKNIINCDNSIDDVSRQVIMMCDTENNTIEEISEPNDIFDDSLVPDTSALDWNGDIGKDQGCEDTLDAGENERILRRSLNFTPKECNLLLQCARRERKIIISKCTTAHANRIKDLAWSRITNCYNRLSPTKRSTKVLRTKFGNLKRLAKRVRIKDYPKITKKQDKLEECSEIDSDRRLPPGDPIAEKQNFQKIKYEPENEYEINDNNQTQDIDDGDDLNDTISEENHNSDSTADPLCTVLNSDCGIDPFNRSENKGIGQLEMELMNYKMETAKLQRKRIEDIIQADAKEREARAIETSLRLRKARLEAIAAEMKLPSTHPGLAYTVEESRAQQYIHQYNTS